MANGDRSEGSPGHLGLVLGGGRSQQHQQHQQYRSMTPAEFEIYFKQVQETGKTEYRFLRVIKLSSMAVSGCNHYITFEANANGPAPIHFQALVYAGIPKDRIEVISCRPKPNSPQVHSMLSLSFSLNVRFTSPRHVLRSRFVAKAPRALGALMRLGLFKTLVRSCGLKVVEL
ncbi:hypothetical protein RHGRI_023291 [Rhododendron griersonianum]|uniref:Cysteine proteinase inhibitor n=1 Tax=Rhododendron griersonianum TaxID=479676 RepID=A0AAV6J2R9_9ERIC|nr:hypothetical protein RHGRI_023291 [Rhododendron griersonianum]